MSAIITDELISIFNGHKDILLDYYEREYRHEVSYEEFFMWWYHFFYTNVTERLIMDETIVLPKGDNFQYIVEK